MLRNIKDWRGVAFIATIAVIQMALFFLVSNVWIVIIAVALLVPFQVSASALNHNHHHCETFRFAWLNRLYEFILFLQTGTTPLTWTLHHNIGHHENFMDQKSDTSPWMKRNGQKMSRPYYCIRNSIMMYPGAWKVGRSHPQIFRRFLIFLGVSSVIMAALLLGSPLKALIIFVIPMTGMLFVLVDTTYHHHAGLVTEDAYAATFNILSPAYNVCAWNLGYHTAHHLRPGLHWTNLPEFHERIQERIPTTLVSQGWPFAQKMKVRFGLARGNPHHG
jgi:fatty acid desaturase